MKAQTTVRQKHLSVKTPNRTKTMGNLVIENAQKDHPGIVGVEELVIEANKDYEKNLLECLARGKKHYENDFYVVALFKKERLFEEVHRLMWFPRQSCPTPTYSQIVYRYQKNPEKFEFLWVLPDQDTCQFYCYNALSVVSEERDLLNFILEFRSGDLDQKVRTLNNEPDNRTGIILVSQ